MHEKNLRNKPIVMTYCGDLGLEEVYDLLLPHTKSLPSRNEKKTSIKSMNPLTEKIVHIPMDREQTQIFMGIPTENFDSKESIYLKMFTTHLSGLSSELFVDVRDRKGLCYVVQPVHFTAIEEIITKYQKEGISQKGFERIKDMIAGQNLLNLRTNEDYANTYSVPYLHGFGIDQFYKKNELIKNLNFETFNKGIKKILSKKISTVLVGREIN